MRTDDMVREALADLAPTAPADNTALAGMHRAIGRRRRRQQVARIAAAVTFVALAVGAGAVLQAENDPTVSTDPDETTLTTQTTTPTTTPTTPSTTEGNQVEPTRFGPVTFQLPEGWEIIDQHDEPSTNLDTGEPGPTGETMCIAPAGNPGPQWDGCGGLLIHQGDFLPGNEMFPYEPHTAGAWSHSTDANPCPLPAGAPVDTTDNYVQTNSEPIEQGLRPVGDRQADYDRWPASCPSGETFEPQAWFLPQSRVLIFDIFGHDETEAFLASFEFDG